MVSFLFQTAAINKTLYLKRVYAILCCEMNKCIIIIIIISQTIIVPTKSIIDGSQNHTVTVEKGSNTQKCWKTNKFVGAEGFF